MEKVLYDIASNFPSRIKDTGPMLDIIDEINNSSLPTNSILVGFDIVNIFPSIDNKSGLKSVHDILELLDSKFALTSCVIEVLELCLSCNILFLTTQIIDRLMVQLRDLICLAPMKI